MRANELLKTFSVKDLSNIFSINEMQKIRDIKEKVIEPAIPQAKIERKKVSLAKIFRDEFDRGYNRKKFEENPELSEEDVMYISEKSGYSPLSVERAWVLYLSKQYGMTGMELPTKKGKMLRYYENKYISLKPVFQKLDLYFDKIISNCKKNQLRISKSTFNRIATDLSKKLNVNRSIVYGSLCALTLYDFYKTEHIMKYDDVIDPPYSKFISMKDYGYGRMLTGKMYYKSKNSKEENDAIFCLDSIIRVKRERKREIEKERERKRQEFKETKEQKNL